MATRKNKIQNDLLWYKDAVIYELHIKAFCDSNGNGIGDFTGLISKLDYLQGLGVTAIWVLPFYPSPLRDDGYDIADYYNINPAYGNIRQFKKLIDEAHKRNLKVITELVINHTSDQHPWFQRARNAPKGSKERDYYVWTDNPHQYKDVRIIFQDFEASNWTWDPVAKQYYWHRFFYHQPDLNFDNPIVQKEIFKILDYWCNMGVDGFRLDAVPYLFEREGTNGENLPETHAFLKKLRKHVDTYYPGTLLLAEANMWPEDSASYFGDGDECHMNYHFPVMPRMFMSLQMEDRHPITDIFDQTPEIPENCQWAMFLRNHDELTLEMVTDEERDYMYKVYVKDPKAKINLGIRHRLAPLMNNSRRKIELLNYLLFSLPGTPVIYYGDEIGMGDNFYLGDRNGVRTPMQWSADRNAGFSTSDPYKLYLPVIADPEYHYETINVDVQSKNPTSLLWWMKRLIRTRKQYQAFSRGDMRFIHTENPKILAFTRSFKGETILVIANLSRYMQPVEIDLAQYAGSNLVELFSKNIFPEVKSNDPYLFSLGAHDCQWFLVQQKETEDAIKQDSPALEVKRWKDLLTGHSLHQLEERILPDYLMQIRWFGGKGRKILTINIIGNYIMETDGEDVTTLIVEVNYESGLSDLYQLPVTFCLKNKANELKLKSPKSIISDIIINGEECVLFDAIYDHGFQKELFKAMSSGDDIILSDSEINFKGTKQLKQYSKENKSVKAKVLAAEQSNSSITFDNKYFLKIYRKVDRAVNPDLELTQFLTKKAGFAYVPAYAGSIEWVHENGTMVLGMMQEMVDNNGDAWSYMLDRLHDYHEKVLATNTNEMPAQEGSLMNPLNYDEIPYSVKNLIEASVGERARLLGERTAQMHMALASDNIDTAFASESFSLHYQRSLFSSFQSLVRSTFQNQSRNLKKLSPELEQEARDIMSMKAEILNVLKRVYRKKFEAMKIRIHGDYHLGQVLITGKDYMILDFEGEPARSYSERRLKRSPLRDVAGMIRSFHYAAYGSLFLNNRFTEAEINRLLPYAEQWYHYMSGFFMEAYLKTANGSEFIPADKEDLLVMMQTYILEKAIYELNYELNNRPDWVLIPLRGIRAVMDENKDMAKDVN